MDYLAQCGTHCGGALNAMTPAGAAERCGFPWYDLSVAELVLLNLRHVQHHAGQLALMLRRHAGIGVGWIGSAALREDSRPPLDPRGIAMVSVIPERYR